MKNAVVVLPTYNEAENIIQIISAILAQQNKLGDLNLSVLVVDDSSPDGTARIVKKYFSSNPHIHLLGEGKKEGLGAAYIRGFEYAMDFLNADIILEMDADFSHNPNDIPKLIHEINMGSDFVIGSRYVEGGSIPAGWPKLRKANSKWGNIFARYIAGLRKIHDCTSGYRAIDVGLLRKINLRKLKTKGYAFQISLLHHAVKSGARVTEAPISFIDRVKGESKISSKDVVEFMATSFFLRLKSLSRIISILQVTIVSGLLASAFTLIFLHLTVTYSAVVGILFFMSLAMAYQGIFTLFCMLYAWEDAEKIEEDKTSIKFVEPKHSFTALVPARDEERVIGDTISAIARINYPSHLVETLIICKDDDYGTIEKVSSVLATSELPNVRLVTFSGNVISKPHSLNVGFKNSANDIVVIFDAEDQPHADIYRVINTVFTNEFVDVVQSGVQLMNFKSKWFSSLNVLEYFFWFKSSMHFFSRMGVVPLGGNTVFFKRNWIERIGGWNEECLTEDAEIGFKMSAQGARIKVIYDEQHVTKEETPDSLRSFVKQRTRWNQGFIQVFREGEWLNLEKTSQKILALYILLLPEFQAFMFALIPISILMVLLYKIPVIFAMLTLLPILILILQFVTYNVGLYEFAKDYKLKYPLWMPFLLLVTFLPYQLVLGYSAIRAVVRTIAGDRAWEKTLHTNAHRQELEYSPAYS